MLGGMSDGWGSTSRGHRIEARTAPGMTTGDATKGQPAAADRPVRPQRLDGVERAGRGKAAAAGQHRGDQIAVKQNQPLQDQAQEPVEGGETGPGDGPGAGALAHAVANSAIAEPNCASRSA
jgi:hypothetical protein